MSLTDYPSSELEPRKLGNEEIADPYKVIHSLFDFAHLPQIREMLWDFLKITVSGTWHALSTSDRADMLYFFEKLEKVVEASHIIHKQNKTAKL